MSKKSEFNPYVNNAGTVVAVATGDRCVVGADTRISQGYSIISRDHYKVTELTPTVVLATSGMVTDAQTLHNLILSKVKLFKFSHGEYPGIRSIAKLLSNTLYYRRFFPYYTFNLLAGLDEDGKGVVFGYDAIGSFDQMKYGAQGSGIQLLISVLDNQIKGTNQTEPRNVKRVGDSVEYTGDPLELVKDVMTSCAERDIYTGDRVEIWDIGREGIRRDGIPLRFD